MKQVIRPHIKEKYNIEDNIYTLLLDMNSIMKMSMVDKRLNTDGVEYGMIFQTLLQIRNLLQKKDFDFVYAFYDGDNSGQLRANIYPEYKANRDKNYKINQTDYDKSMDDFCKKVIAYSKSKRKINKHEEDENESFSRQREIIFNILEEVFVRQVICDDIEGDDLIAYYVNHKKQNEKIVIVSGDRDLTQLISKDVCVYIHALKKFITVDNHIHEIGYTHENVLLKKIICGDSSDNIKGIKGVGEKTFFELFPEAKNRKMELNEVIEKAQNMINERIKNHKKPLESTKNIVNSITLGSQGKNIYEINEKIINLKHPLLSQEAIDELESISYAPLDITDRDISNVYRIIQKNNITDLIDENRFMTFFSPYVLHIEKEKKFFNKNKS